MNYKETYTKMFENKNYNADRNIVMDIIVNYMIKYNIKNTLDIGSGRGHLIKKLLKEKINTTSLDLEKFHSEDISFIKADISEENSKFYSNTYESVVALDVLEHLDLKDIKTFINNIKTKYLFVTIGNHSDIIDEIELHRTIQSKEKWQEVFNKKFNILEDFTLYEGRLYGFIMEDKNDR